jgi:pilus assembly protein CpaB
MRNKALLMVLAGAVIFGLIAAVSVSRFLSGARGNSEGTTVVIARMEIPLGAMILREQLTTAQMPGDAVPEGAFPDLAKALGRVTSTRIAAREPVTENRLAPEGSAAGLSALIPEGYRAITVKVDDEAGIAGFLMPGTLVDVLAVINPPNESSGQNPISKIVLQNIKVLASGQNLDQPKDGREPVSIKTATLLVTPEQAEKLVLSSFDGRLRLALRNTIDQGDEKTPGANKNTLLTGERAQLIPDVKPLTNSNSPQSPRPPQRKTLKPVISSITDKLVPPATPAPAPPRLTVEIFEGGKKRQIDFPK